MITGPFNFYPVSLGYHENVPQTRCLKTTAIQSSGSWNSKFKVSVGFIPSEGSESESVPPSQLLVVAGNPWLVDSSLQLLPLSSLRLLPSMSVYLNLSLSVVL